MSIKLDNKGNFRHSPVENTLEYNKNMLRSIKGTLNSFTDEQRNGAEGEYVKRLIKDYSEAIKVQQSS